MDPWEVQKVELIFLEGEKCYLDEPEAKGAFDLLTP